MAAADCDFDEDPQTDVSLPSGIENEVELGEC
jgi:hypothetical protein